MRAFLLWSAAPARNAARARQGALCVCRWFGEGRGEETRRPNFPELFQVSLGEYGFIRAVCLSVCVSVCRPAETRQCGSLTGKFQTFLKEGI